MLKCRLCSSNRANSRRILVWKKNTFDFRIDQILLWKNENILNRINGITIFYLWFEKWRRFVIWSAAHHRWYSNHRSTDWLSIVQSYATRLSFSSISQKKIVQSLFCCSFSMIRFILHSSPTIGFYVKNHQTVRPHRSYEIENVERK